MFLLSLFVYLFTVSALDLVILTAFGITALAKWDVRLPLCQQMDPEQLVYYQSK
jgi:hypothetical protein